MKTLLLLRHAHAENPAAGQADVDRPLNEQGSAEARALGSYLKEQGSSVELLLCSAATRAKQTAQLVCDGAGINPITRFEQQIYEASSFQLLELILKIDVDCDFVMLVGHNPAMAELIHVLTDRAAQLSPCSLAKIEVETSDWSEVAEVNGKLVWVLKPDDFNLIRFSVH
jgi:phosphohistidine phosphatase